MKIYLAIPAAIFFFVCAVYIHRSKKTWEKDLYEKLWSGTKSQGIVDYENESMGNMPLENTFANRNRSDAEDIRSGMGLVVFFRYLDWMCIIAGILTLVLFWNEVSENPYKDIVLKWVIGGIVTVICLAVGVVYSLKAYMGKDTKKIQGTIVNVYKKVPYDDYRMDVQWKDEKGRNRIYQCSYNFRKYNCPNKGDSCELIYSYQYDNVKFQGEIRQTRRYSFYGFGLAVVMVIIIILNMRLY